MVFVNIIWQLVLINLALSAVDDDYNVVRKDGSFEFGYTNPDSYHFADGTRNNIVRGEFGGRNPKTGTIDTTLYTAGPRGFRPRGKNVHRKYDLNQNGPRPIGSRDDPYYDPYEDPSYSFGFKTRTYSRQENANRVGDVTGRFTYLDDIGERHNVDFIAGKNTGFHVKTPFPDSNPRAYGPLYFRGRGRPIPRGRTSIQRGLDGSYKFVSSGPDQRRTEVSDSTGHVRGSYTYLDDKGVQHSVHYIAGPETGYRVLKTVKGAHLPTVFPFERPEILPPDFYGYGLEGEVFDTAASGRPVKPGAKPQRPSPDLGNGIDVSKDDYDRFGGDKEDGFTDFGAKKPSSSTTSRPSPFRPAGRPTGDESDDDEASLDFGDLFDGGGSTTARPSTGRPSITTSKPTSKPSDEEDDGSYKPFQKPGAGGGGGSISTTGKPSGYPSGRPKPGSGTLGIQDDYDYNEAPDKGLFGSESGRPFGGGAGGGGYEEDLGGPVLQVGGGKGTCPKCTGTIVTNIGYRPFRVPPGASVRAYVQSIDLYPYEGLSPSEALKADIGLKTEQLNEASTEIVRTSTSVQEEEEEEDHTKDADASVTTTDGSV